MPGDASRNECSIAAALSDFCTIGLGNYRELQKSQSDQAVTRPGTIRHRDGDARHKPQEHGQHDEDSDSTASNHPGTFATQLAPASSGFRREDCGTQIAFIQEMVLIP